MREVEKDMEGEEKERQRGKGRKNRKKGNKRKKKRNLIECPKFKNSWKNSGWGRIKILHWKNQKDREIVDLHLDD